jgi:hypothetical protein
MSVCSLQSIAAGAPSHARRLLERLRASRGDDENPYSPAASLALLFAVGIVVKFLH